MVRFFILFIVLLVSLFTIEVLQPVQEHVILPFTAGLAWISVNLIELFDSGVVSAGKVIRDLESGFAVSIEPGCNGFMIDEAMDLIIVPSNDLVLKGPVRLKDPRRFNRGCIVVYRVVLLFA